ncbi:hypothetical protein GCM10011416_05340 [Polaribacter pacificus]|uniref:Uncharacterized protein n=1 Tax=Polaribacter pacificus TaxID=1775173 RepID=A0A917HW32_9FLAO|nr:hypothetical protein [Polaribacter pacificus]GGG91605.1 hypothetical protein GCM10011416_05340 [Polaribacter pacificus]
MTQLTVIKPAETEGFLLPKLGLLMLFGLFLFLFNFIIVKNKLTRDNLYAFLLLVIFLGTVSNSLVNLNNLLVQVLILLTLRKVYSIRKLNNVLSKLFDSGLWLGVAFLLEPFSIVFLLMIYAAVVLFYEVSVKTLLIPILGFCSPLFLFFTYLFFVDQTDIFYSLFTFTTTYDFSSYDSVFYSTSFFLFFGALFVAIISRTPRVFSVNNKFRRSWFLLLFHLAVALAFVLLIKQRDGSELIAVFIPMSIIIANWLQFLKKKLFVDLILLLFLGYSIAIHFIV